MSEVITFGQLEVEVKKRFGQLEQKDLSTQVTTLVEVLEIEDPQAVGVTPEQFQQACLLLDLVHSQKAANYHEAKEMLSNAEIEVAPTNGLDQMIDRQADQIVDTIPITVAAVKGEMEQGIQYALMNRVAQKIGEMDIDAAVEQAMQEQPKKPPVNVLGALGLELPTSQDPKRLMGS